MSILPFKLYVFPPVVFIPDVWSHMLLSWMSHFHLLFLYESILSKLKPLQPIFLCLIRCEYFLDPDTDSLPTTFTYRSTNSFPVLLEMPHPMHPENAFIFLTTEEKIRFCGLQSCWDEILLHYIFPPPSQYSLSYIVYIVWMLHTQSSMYFSN